MASELAEASARGIAPELLDHELQRRGKEWVDLTRYDPSGMYKLNPTTVSKLRHRKYVKGIPSDTLIKLNGWLKATPILPEVDRLLVRPRLEGAA